MSVPQRPETTPEASLFPVFLRLDGARVLVVGGGQEAVAKLRLLLPTGAAITVLAEEADEALEDFEAEGRLRWHRRGFTPADLTGARLCIVALDDAAEASAVVQAARDAGVLVNAVDRPALSDFDVPALVDRAPVTIAIGSAGAAPALARDLRSRVEAAIPPGYAGLGALCRDWRARVAAALPDRAARRRFWDAAIEGPEAAAVIDGDRQGAEHLIAARLEAAKHGLALRPQGRASLVGAGPGDPDFLTMRALRVLKRADVVLYDALVEPAVLDLARRDARRINVGKRCGRHAMSQTAINRLIVQHAQAGHHVVRLKGGDPFIFGRGGEELDCLREAGVPVEVVPGITAACAVAARLAIPLTHREVARSLHFVTGHGSDGAVPDLDWRTLAAGGTVAAYMASRTLATVAARLMEAGLDGATPAVAVENATRPEERHLFGTLADLPAALAAQGFDGPTLVLIGAVVGLARAEADTKPEGVAPEGANASGAQRAA
jgi:uroporphyrin-III C-methyltransferase/precorrin-2 dehydrogenase/sirohydrochlorin ferrochelatase